LLEAIEEQDRGRVPAVQSLKCNALKVINAILEGQTDVSFFKSIAVKLDTEMLRQRLRENHKFFFTEFCPERSILSHARLATDEEMQSFLDHISGQDCETFFAEPFEVMTLVRAMSFMNAAFKVEMDPGHPYFLDDPLSYADEHTYKMAKRDYTMALEYYHAFHFFSRQIRNVEVILDNQQLTTIYFRKPIESWYFASAAKEQIRQTVDFTTQDGKIAHFITMVDEQYETLQQTRALSRWQLRCRCLPRSLQRPFRFFLQGEMRNLNRLRVLMLMLASALAFCMAIFLGEDHSTLTWSISGPPGESRNQRRLQASTSGGGDDGFPFDENRGGISGMKYAWSGAATLIRAIGGLYSCCAAMNVIVMFSLYVPVMFKNERKHAHDLYIDTGIGASVFSKVATAVGVLLVLAAFAFSLYWSVGFEAFDFAEYSAFPLMIVFCPSVFIVREILGHFGKHRPGNVVYCAIRTAAVLMKTSKVFTPAVFFYFSVVSVCTTNPFFYTIALFDIINVFPELQLLFDAFIGPIKSLLLFGLLMMVVFFTFAVDAYLYQNDNFHAGECKGISSCFIYSVWRGTNEGSLFASRESYATVSEAVYDYFFVFLIAVVLMTIFAGMIIDSFAKARTSRGEQALRLAESCFISGIPIERLKKAARKLGVANGDQLHLTECQYMWDYSSFILLLQTKAETEFTGPEQYIKTLLDTENTNWIPSLRCSLVERAEESEKHEGDGLEVAVNSLKKDVRDIREMIQKMAASMYRPPSKTDDNNNTSNEVSQVNTNMRISDRSFDDGLFANARQGAGLTEPPMQPQISGGTNISEYEKEFEDV